MRIRCPGRPTLAILSVALLCGACTGSGRVTSASPAASPSVATAAGAATPAARETAIATAAPPAGTSAEPPAATLAAEGGDPVKGQLGSYAWAGGGSDSPWLPGAPLHVGAGERLTLSITDGVVVAEWSARRVPAGSTNGSGAVALGDGPAPVAFDAPAAGSWSVQAVLRFADDLGSATYYWRLDVD